MTKIKYRDLREGDIVALPAEDELPEERVLVRDPPDDDDSTMLVYCESVVGDLHKVESTNSEFSEVCIDNLDDEIELIERGVSLYPHSFGKENQ